MPDAQYQTGTKIIACILPKGRARALQQSLVEQKGIHTGTFHYGRGVGRESHIRDRGIGEQQEREIFEIIVDADRAEEIFEFVFFEANMDERHGGMIYMTRAERSTALTLPNIKPEAR